MLGADNRRVLVPDGGGLPGSLRQADLVVGTSSGALAGTQIAADRDPELLCGQMINAELPERAFESSAAVPMPEGISANGQVVDQPAELASRTEAEIAPVVADESGDQFQDLT
ncbi:hypothetical protein [Amycolatopsis japonica]